MIIKVSIKKHNKNKQIIDGINSRTIDIDNTYKDAILIEGGGTKGIYAIGILKYLFGENPYLRINSVSLFGGTSVGSYIALMLSIGYNLDDLQKIATEIDPSTLFDKPYMLWKTIYRFLFYGYMYDPSKREDIIKTILSKKIDILSDDLGKNITVDKLTFGDLKILIKSFPNKYKDLLVNTVDLSRGHQLFITTLEDKWNDIKIIDALMASSAIPIFFKPVQLFYNEYEDVYGYNNSNSKCYLVDGATSTNNPTDYVLLNAPYFLNYNIWLIKFTCDISYYQINTRLDLLSQLTSYLVSGKNDVKTNIIHEYFMINTINLKLSVGTLDIYKMDEINKIIDDIYDKCIQGDISFNK